MSSPRALRWMVLLSALGATIAAIIYPVDGTGEQVVIEAMAPRPAVVRASLAMPVAAASPAWQAADDNPFAPRIWAASPVAAPADVRHVEAVELPQAPAEQPPPPLPYTFLGQMQNDGERILYLGRGEQVLLAHKGDLLDNNYKVLDVTDALIEFEIIQSGIRQSLPIPAQ